jgi:GntR family transcriptional repressor for pyruvate dehydrogenase complex
MRIGVSLWPSCAAGGGRYNCASPLLRNALSSRNVTRIGGMAATPAARLALYRYANPAHAIRPDSVLHAQTSVRCRVRPDQTPDLRRHVDAGRSSTRLEADGYIETSGRGGFTVVDVTAPIISKPLAELLLQNPRTSADILELRQGLESISTVYAAERATAGDLEKIRSAFEELKAGSLSGDRTNLAELDAAFHLAIADSTHNIALAHVMHGIHTLIREGMRQYHRLIDYDDAKERQLLTQHQAIFDAVMARDAQKARKAAERHLTFVRDLYEEEGTKPT